MLTEGWYTFLSHANLLKIFCISKAEDKVLNLFFWNCSMAVLFLREMSLPCTEQQMEALTRHLSRPEAFGPVSAWGPEVFTEIGTLAGTVEHNIPGDINFFCDQLFFNCFFKEWGRQEKEMTALGWIGTIKKSPRGYRLKSETGKFRKTLIWETLIIWLWCLWNFSLCTAGLEDMVLSALVQEQVEGITSEAIALMPPAKMAVSFTRDFRAIY